MRSPDDSRNRRNREASTSARRAGTTRPRRPHSHDAIQECARWRRAYDIHSYVDVPPLLAKGGLPSHRPTSARARHDALSFEHHGPERPAVRRGARHHRLMDALKIGSAIVGGFDRGARTANIIAALWPGALQGSPLRERLSDRQPRGQHEPAAPPTELQWWYQYYFATERGWVGYEKYWRDFARLIWQIANFDDATFERRGHQRLRQEILGQIRAPDHPRRRRAQPAAGSATGLRRRRGRCSRVSMNAAEAPR